MKIRLSAKDVAMLQAAEQADKMAAVASGMQSALFKAKWHDDKLDAAERSPDGDDYNVIMQHVRAALDVANAAGLADAVADDMATNLDEWSTKLADAQTRLYALANKLKGADAIEAMAIHSIIGDVVYDTMPK